VGKTTACRSKWNKKDGRNHEKSGKEGKNRIARGTIVDLYQGYYLTS
jgi:hypothetical protein